MVANPERREELNIEPTPIRLSPSCLLNIRTDINGKTYIVLGLRKRGLGRLNTLPFSPIGGGGQVKFNILEKILNKQYPGNAQNLFQVPKHGRIVNGYVVEYATNERADARVIGTDRSTMFYLNDSIPIDVRETLVDETDDELTGDDYNAVTKKLIDNYKTDIPIPFSWQYPPNQLAIHLIKSVRDPENPINVINDHSLRASARILDNNGNPTLTLSKKYILNSTISQEITKSLINSQHLQILEDYSDICSPLVAISESRLREIFSITHNSEDIILPNNSFAGTGRIAIASHAKYLID